MKVTLSFIFLLLSFTYSVYGQENTKDIRYFSSFDEVNIAYTDTGEGFPILLVHGFINSGSSWNGIKIKESLLSNGYRLIIPDLRGNGNSDKPEKESAYQNDAEVKDLKKLMKHLKIKRYYAIGYSRGSILLAKLLTQDRRIKKAVLGGMGIDFTNPDWERRIMFMKGFAGHTDQYPETIGAVEYAKSVNGNLRILSLSQKYQPVTSLTALSKIKANVLIIAGNQDLDNGNPKSLSDAIPGSRLKIVPGDHNTAYRESYFSETVFDFLHGRQQK